METESLLSELRQPDYIDENRCTPCTVVNVAIALGASTVIALVSPLLAPVVLIVCLATIYLRGYFVPGTPELTKQYLPDRVLRWFDKAPSHSDATLVGTADEAAEIDSEPILLNANVLEFTPDGADLQLTETFQTDWRTRIEAVRGNEYELYLARLLSGDETITPRCLRCAVTARSSRCFEMTRQSAMWMSKAALIADLAAEPLLRDRLPDWETTELGVRGQLLHGMLVFLEQCPRCDADLALSEQTVESCCRTAEVITLICTNCETPVLEAVLEGVEDIANEQGSSNPQVVMQNYLSDERARTVRREFMREQLAEAFGAAEMAASRLD